MRSYDLHGLRLAVTGWEEAAAALHGRLESLASEAAGEPDLVFEIGVGPEVDGFERPERGRPVYEPPVGEVLFDDAADRIWIGLGPDRRAVCEPARGRARLWARHGTGEDLWLLSHPLFTLPLVEMLKRRGLWALHAAGLLWNGKAVVLAGASGAGKSTLTLALVRAGFGFLGDDTLFLKPGSGGLRLLAFPDEVDLTEETAAFFPELAPLRAEPRREGWRKRRLRAEETYGAPLAAEVAPGLLVFPRISGREESALSPMEPGEALIELASNVLLTEPASSQAHLDALAALTAASSCWRLETGRDLASAVRLLRDLAER
ncbi:MAG TPA: hypothetical protein VKM72_04600 [Thermoanaerobaculia bacterium]|nr:hypothetical protein [Thermoanaerobaculia bacterium]